MNRRRRLLTVAAFVAIAGAFAWMRFSTHDAPAGQAPLAYLDSASLATFKSDFNRAAGDTRMIVLMSPT